MTTTLDESLYQAAVETLEQLSYLLAMPPGDGGDPRDPAAAVASVEFHGPLSGRLELVASQPLLEALAANMLGEDEGLCDLQRLDALMEAANVVCGNLLPQIGGREAVFHMVAPQVRDPQDGAVPAPEGRAVVDLDEGWAEVRLYLTGQSRDGAAGRGGSR
jgi:hypothetical protein